VLLTPGDETAGERLARREIGSQLDAHRGRIKVMARRLDEMAPSWMVRVPTDGREVVSIPCDLIATTHWAV